MEIYSVRSLRVKSKRAIRHLKMLLETYSMNLLLLRRLLLPGGHSQRVCATRPELKTDQQLESTSWGFLVSHLQLRHRGKHHGEVHALISDKGGLPQLPPA